MTILMLVPFTPACFRFRLLPHLRLLHVSEYDGDFS